MLFRTFEIFQNRVEYTRNADGSWKAEFHGAAPFGMTLALRTLKPVNAIGW